MVKFNPAILPKPPPGTTQLAGFPTYAADKQGNIWTCHRHARSPFFQNWRKLSPKLLTNNKGSYALGVTLCWNGARKYAKVHQLILETFVGPKPAGMECRHLDGDFRNNRVTNLCWGTPKENSDDRERHGKTPKGINRWNAILTEEDVQTIRKRCSTGERGIITRTAKEFGIAQVTVSKIIARQTWKHLPQTTPNGGV